MSIILVRHGETAGNAGRVIQRSEVPLNERGIRQAEQLAERLQSFEIAHILCSDLMRARMTAAPLLLRTRGTIEESALLQERNFGDLRGTSYAELREDPFGVDFVPPNGESWPAFHERVAAAFKLIAARRSALRGDLLVITHGLVCGALLHQHLQLGPDLVPPRGFDNTAVTIIDAAAPYTVRLLNCTRHLSADLGPRRDAGAA
jgi:2,3-bisphosphoglycerate-dependent phosphoglycerate mutase